MERCRVAVTFSRFLVRLDISVIGMQGRLLVRGRRPPVGQLGIQVPLCRVVVSAFGSLQGPLGVAEGGFGVLGAHRDTTCQSRTPGLEFLHPAAGGRCAGGCGLLTFRSVDRVDRKRHR